MTRPPALLSLAVCAALVAPGVASSITIDTPFCTVRKSPPLVGIYEISRAAVDERLLDLRVHSDAMQGTQPVYVLLPTNYDPSGATRYPVLYLLHGALDDYTSWPVHGVDDVVGDRQMIVVMPDDLRLGSYADWYGMVAGVPGPIPSLETYHTAELIPFIDAAFPTVADPSGRFVAGLSSGGSGTYKYSAAHPGLFGAAGGFSAAVHITIDHPFYPTINEALWTPSLIPGYGPPGFCTFGDPYTQQ
ncbi:MAG: alpha/beta hydrolase, partial [Actinomycetota bacterium]